MKNRILPLLLSAVFIIVCASSLFIGDTGAHTYNSDTWTGKISPAEPVVSAVSSNLLSQSGMKVLLRDRTADDGVFTVPIKLYSTDGVISGTMSATASDEWVTLSLSDTTLSLSNAAERTVNLRVTPKASYEDQGVLHEPPDVLTFRVEWRGNGGTIYGDFTIDNRENRTVNSGATITVAPEYYLKNVPMYLTLNSAATLKFGDPQGDFPAGTKYTFGGHDHYLFDADVIDVAASGEVAIDFSSANVNGTVLISVGSATRSVDRLTPIASDYKDDVLVIGAASSVDLGLPYEWSGISPSVTVSRLTRQNGTASWVSAGAATVSDSGGSAYLVTSGAAAGGYRIDISWSVNGHVLYEERIPFFVTCPLYGQS